MNTKLNEQARDAKLASAAMASSAGGGGGGRGRTPNSNSSNDSGGFWNQIKGTAGKVSGAFDDVGARVGRVSSLFHRSSKGMADDTGLITRGITSLNRNMRMVGSSIIFFQLLSGAITNTAGFMLDAAKTNSRFSSSLNLIKVNLMTAFYPIYTAVMPALNTLMAGLAKVTGYVAGFIATLFGTTYHAARQGAQGLYGQMQAMKDTSKSAKAGLDDTADGAKKIADNADGATKKAKELKNALMGFDEINLLNQDSGDDDDKIKTPKAPSSKKVMMVEIVLTHQVLILGQHPIWQCRNGLLILQIMLSESPQNSLRQSKRHGTRLDISLWKRGSMR
ncbi:hypothetical protein [Lacticaseibacillus saniviri]|uniref:hypothetical protein n=1 Tax=Lacticaseibacillus saniviri TaxID=931533 RepID=UPI0006CFEADE|nr:hypothetical protein [Lacticaseibacillus saniviri]